MIVNLHSMYEFYKEHTIGDPVDLHTYKEIIRNFNKISVIKILEGDTLHLGAMLGELRIRKVERTFKTLKINWAETHKLKKETGLTKYVYFTDSVWYRYYWSKKNAVVRNKSAYRFLPAKGKDGAKAKLVRLLKTDEFAHLNFKP